MKQQQQPYRQVPSLAVLAARYTAPVTGEFQVNNYTTLQQGYPIMTMDSDA